MIAEVESTTPPTIGVCRNGLDEMDNEPDSLQSLIVFAVTPGYYYRVASVVVGVGCGNYLLTWIEVEL